MQFLKQGIPTGAAIKGLSSIDPKISKFIKTASLAGYGTNAILDYFKDAVSPKGAKLDQQRMESRAAKGTARPDEVAALSEEEASLPSVAGKAASVGIPIAAGLASAGALGGATAAAQAAPAAAAAIQGAAAPAAAPAAPAAATKLGLFEQAMKGISFFDLSDDQKTRIGPMKKRLDALDSQGATAKDKAVKTLFRAIDKIVNKSGVVEQEAERFAQGQAPAAPQSAAPAQAPSMDPAKQQLLSQVKALSDLLKGQ